MSEKSKITCIVPVYNVEKYLNKCIDSILSQSFPYFELLLIDDGSTDNSGKICDKYIQIDNRVKVIHKSNGGVSSARNTGLDIATGEYICFVDADDYIETDYFSELYFSITENCCDIAICGFTQIKKDSSVSFNFVNQQILSKKEFIIDFFKSFGKNGLQSFGIMAVWNKLYKFSVIEDLRFDISLKNGEDFLFNIDVIRKCDKIFYLNKLLYNYIYNENGASKVGLKNNYDWKRRFYETSSAIQNLKKLLAENTLPEKLISNYIASTTVHNLIENSNNNCLFHKHDYQICKELRSYWKFCYIFVRGGVTKKIILFFYTIRLYWMIDFIIWINNKRKGRC